MNIREENILARTAYNKSAALIIGDEILNLNRTFDDILDLSGRDLSGRDLSGLYLKWVNLSNANLSKCTIHGTYFNHVILRGADLSGADILISNVIYSYLSEANLSNAKIACVSFDIVDLVGSNFENASINSSSFDKSNLSNANFRSADINDVLFKSTTVVGAEFTDASLKDNQFDDVSMENTILPDLPYRCPPTGGFTAWKKARSLADDGWVLIRLFIPKDARRSSGNGDKCRCDRAMVVDIVHAVDNSIHYKTARSVYEPSFIYEVGNTIESGFDDNRWNECSDGIHFFMEKETAREYHMPRRYYTKRATSAMNSIYGIKNEKEI